MGLLDWDDEESSKRSLTIREKKILYTRANGKCELCGERIGFLEMQVGHKIAASRGGSAPFAIRLLYVSSATIYKERIVGDVFTQS